MCNSLSNLLIVGRGPTAYEFRGWSEYTDIMAVSSGIFALPTGLLPKHFVSMDQPKYFLGPINQHDIAWGLDPNAKDWPFWGDASIAKHVSATLAHRGTHRSIPLSGIVETIEEYYGGRGKDATPVRKAFYKAFDDVQHNWGYQPGWMDYPNVKSWTLVLNKGPQFGGTRDLGLSKMRNSMFMAVQVAARLGYTNLDFVGVFDGDGYEPHREVFSQWHETAKHHGMTWRCLNPKSALSCILPTPQMELSA